MERIDSLEQEHRDLMAGFRVHYGQHAPKHLEQEQARYFAKLNVPNTQPERRDESQLLSEMFTLGALLNKPVS